MCAINGITRRDTDLVEKMNAITSHRGPDGSGVVPLEAVTLGHNRLSIIDTSDNGSQPMWSQDKSCVLVYNGEIYNFRELRQQLSDYHYTSNTDSEVILAAYKRWGAECVKKLNGIFAFALWDSSTGTLLLARDPFGVKPLFYAFDKGALVFSSEVKAILETVHDRTLNHSAFHQFMYMNHSTGGEQLISGMYEFPPGQYAVFKDEKLQFTQYWSSDFSMVGKANQAEYVERIRDTIGSTVASQLVSDRPVGLLLSGGIDSSTLLATATKLKGQIKTFTTSFDRESSNIDAELAARTAQHFGAEHTDIRVSDDAIIPLLEEAVWYLESPTNSATVVSQLCVAKQVNQSITVLLGGDGGDELFGGYTRYQLALAANYYQLLPRVLRQPLNRFSRLAKLNRTAGLEQFKLFYGQNPAFVQSLLSHSHDGDVLADVYAQEFGDLEQVDAMTKMLEADRRLLRFGSLLRTDKMFMAAGIEARVPLLDQTLARLADTIPVTNKVSLFDTKIILKQAMRDRLPEYLFKEKKRGWVSPVGTWMRRPLFQTYMREVLSAGYYTETSPLFNWTEVEKLIDAQASGDTASRTFLWSLLTFQLWARRFEVKL